MTRHTSTHPIWLASLLLAACANSHGGESPPPAPGTDAGDGVCCPIADFEGCSPGEERPGGGWARRRAECTYTIGGFDGAPWVRAIDDHGCPVLREDRSVTPCGSVALDAGPPAPPPPPASPCDDLGPAACLADVALDCAPAFDDACCPSCDPTGACADCIDWAYRGCRPRTSVCLTGDCATVPSWACGPAAPVCETAVRVGLTSCDRVGCVPAFAPEGGPEPTVACVPILGTSCTVFCRRAAPDCPEGTVPEGDGSCYTDRCIPAFVCE